MPNMFRFSLYIGVILIVWSKFLSSDAGRLSHCDKFEFTTVSWKNRNIFAKFLDSIRGKFLSTNHIFHVWLAVTSFLLVSP